MIGVTSVGTRVHFRLFDASNALILQAFLDFEELLGYRRIDRMTSCANSTGPCRALLAEEVTIDRVLDIFNSSLGAHMVWVIILFPTVETRLICREIQLTVMNRSDLVLSLEVVLLGQGSSSDDRGMTLR